MQSVKSGLQHASELQLLSFPKKTKKHVILQKNFVELFWCQFSELIVAKNCSSWFIRRYGSVSYLGHWRCSHFFPRRFQKICNPTQEKLLFLFSGESIVLFVCLFIVFVFTHFFLFRIGFNQENFGELWNQFFFIHPGIF